jgi:hypothetical protein
MTWDDMPVRYYICLLGLFELTSLSHRVFTLLCSICWIWPCKTNDMFMATGVTPLHHMSMISAEFWFFKDHSFIAPRSGAGLIAPDIHSAQEAALELVLNDTIEKETQWARGQVNATFACAQLRNWLRRACGKFESKTIPWRKLYAF